MGFNIYEVLVMNELDELIGYGTILGNLHIQLTITWGDFVRIFTWGYNGI